MRSRSKKNINKNVINVNEDMNNMMIYLEQLELLYFYNESQIENCGNKYKITWKNHVSSRENCGEAFTSINQYSHILKTSAYHCVLFDGSIIRSSFEFNENKLVNHSHLWWPAPYKFEPNVDNDEDVGDKFDDFITSPLWYDEIRMRSPIRIDYDPSVVSSYHPAIHMHTQHHETRMNIDKPICFSKFIKFIFSNYYPNTKIDFSKWHDVNLSVQNKKLDEYSYSSILI